MARWIESSSFKSLFICCVTTQFFATSALATPFPTHPFMDLSLRADSTCGAVSGLSQCGANFPSSFCCPAGSTCVPLNSTAAISVICCPKDSDCSHIQPITCDISQFNATLHPDNQIHIANTTQVQLPQCGSKCCPLGYACNGNTCIAQPSTPSSPTSSPTGTPTSSTTESPAASQTSSLSSPLPASIHQSSFPAKAVVAGFFPGMVLGALLTLLLLWVIKKRRESQKPRYSGDFGHVSRSISDPIYDPVYAARTDFIRRPSNAGTSVQPSPNSTTGMVQRDRGAAVGQAVGSGGWMGSPRVRSLFSKSPKIGFATSTSTPMAAPAPTFRPGEQTRDPYRTPTRSPVRKSSTRRKTEEKRPEVMRSDSTETIDVLMPAPSFLQIPQARENRLTQDTTFTKLMERAGYEEDRRDEVRQWKGSPAARR
ncbi:hypothetical protein GQ43DRAFT_443622 [Delitschia confertaspora ATCC 74209]|uniref:Mid2 domain-containing protein n=1 Tax=Delitschia confertaspora ATCC 74209 TaxID=1513339 RepID=A0A9P4JEY0_9PLEO|nr:hypothetical protein GQ43DRAFT_443622 [Delitschia confertaspora ATCC 74209]